MRILLACSVLIYGSLAYSQETKPDNPTPVEKPVASQAKPQSETEAREPAAQQRSANKADRLDLDTTIVTGNRELPKVLYIVPWKKAEIGDLPAQPFNTLLDEVLSPVDRDVFKREVKYFHTVTRLDATTAPNASEAKETLGTSR